MLNNFRRALSAKSTGGLAKSIMTLVAGNAAAKAIGLASMPIITRLYSPEQMGILSAYMAVVAILAPMVSLRYVTVLPVPRSRTAAVNLLILNFCLILLMSALLAVILGLWGQKLLVEFSFSALNPFLPYILIGIFLSGLYEALSMWGTRLRQYKTLAAGQAWQAIFGNFIKLGFGIMSLGTSGLIAGQTAQYAGGSFALIKMGCGDIWKSRQSISLSRVIKIFLCFKDVLYFRMPSQFLLVLSMQGPLLITSYIYGIEDAGQLGLALSALALPLSILGAAAGNAYYSEISALGRSESAKILELTQALVRRLFLLSIPPAMVLMIAGPWIFSVAFGPEWVKAGEFSRVMSLYLVFQFTSSPLGNVLALYRRQELFLQMNLIRFTMVLSVFYASYLCELDSLSAVLFYSLALSAHYAYTSRVIIGVIKENTTEVQA